MREPVFDSNRGDAPRHEGQRRPYPPRVDQNRSDGRGNDQPRHDHARSDQPRQERPYQERAPQPDRASQSERVPFDRPAQDSLVETPRYAAAQPTPQDLTPNAAEIVASVAPVQIQPEAVAAPKKPRAPSTRKLAAKKPAVDGGSEGSSEPVAD